MLRQMQQRCRASVFRAASVRLARPCLRPSVAALQGQQRHQTVVGSAYKRGGHLPTAAQLNALENWGEEEADRDALVLVPGQPRSMKPPEGCVVVRSHNAPAIGFGSKFPQQAYAAHPQNFTPLRVPHPGFVALDRAVRDVAVESRFDLLERGIKPRYAGECRGTPRRAPQDGMIGEIRVRQVQNPYVRLRAWQKYRLNTFPSKNWARWKPLRCAIQGSRRRYRLPEDISPYKDELGEWHPPRVSSRYKADMAKQYYMQSLPWVWKKDYYRPPQHFMDREPRGPKRWYKKEYRRAQIQAALKRVDSLVEDYRKEKRDAKRLSWVETLALEFAGEQLAGRFVRTRRLPKL
eukprot:TRINITY_DN37297_c0_g1_i2.p2 TRINITY_DN37297_c0_g1~~TRINITY_DN37297_c0_g1_i2.p2  ORF type:complete len:349 (-),score=81.21 TRINITY_DN37297_c0_g1_i2:77-1123(-)